MSLKDEVAAWQKGVDKAAEAKYDEAIACFSEIPEPGARIFFNIASMNLKLGDLESAKKNLDQCLQKDPHHALGYFQRGCLCLQTKSYEEALADFETAQKNLRGNLLIDYKQLGLQYKLYSCEIMYNTAYAYAQLGRKSDAQEQIEKALAMSEQSSENRHKIISSALEDLRTGKSFLPYRLPKSCTVFCPPRNKTESLKPVDFLGKAKVLSSVVDKDDYTGFVGVQDMKQSVDQPSQSTASPRSRSKSPSPMPDPPTASGTKVPRPSGAPPPKPTVVLAPLRKEDNDGLAPDGPAPDVTLRPPKPTVAPPSLMKPSPSQPPKSPPSKSPPPVGPAASREDGMMTVKIHYTTTRAIRISRSTLFEELIQAVCEKCERPQNTLTLWFKKGPGELSEITSDVSLKSACAKLEDGCRLTVWAYDKEESSEHVLKHVVAISDYKGQYGDELSFKTGDKLEVTLDVSDDWYEGKFQGKTGIFPKAYVKEAT